MYQVSKQVLVITHIPVDPEGAPTVLARRSAHLCSESGTADHLTHPVREEGWRSGRNNPAGHTVGNHFPNRPNVNGDDRPSSHPCLDQDPGETLGAAGEQYDV